MESLIEYFDMGGHGSFIWACYGMVTFVLVTLWIMSRRFVRTSQQQLDGLEANRPSRRQRNQSNET